jgi:hypothetical protein
MTHNFKIHAPLTPSGAFVEMDGKRLEGVTRVEFSMAVDQLMEVKLTIRGYLDMTGEFKQGDLVVAERKTPLR